MLWGSTLRSPHPRAKIRSIEIGAALRVPGVHAVLTHEDVPGRKTYGLEIQDQPVLAWEDVRYQGEAVAIIAADHPETARAAAKKIEVDYEVLEPLTDPERALDPTVAPLHPSGNLLRHVPIRHGDPDAEGEVVVTGEYEVGMQDQAFLGPESGLAVPAEDGGVDLFIATQWLHVDQDQLAASLDLPPEKVRLVLGGVGGAFGGREDLIDAGPRVHARAPLRPAREDDVRARGVLLRAHPPPPRADALRAPRARATASSSRCARGCCSTAARTRRAPPRSAPTPPASPSGPTTSRTRASTPTSSTPTTRRAGRCAASAPCRPASRTRRRWTSSPRRWTWTPSSCAGATRCRPARRCRWARPCAARRRSRSCSSAWRRCRSRTTAAASRAGSPTSRAARASCAASATPWATRTSPTPRASTTTRPRACGSRSREASRWSRSTRRPPRSARGWSPCRSRSRARSSASSGSWCCRRTRTSARRGRRRPRARR